jgi:hypothetical protein
LRTASACSPGPTASARRFADLPSYFDLFMTKQGHKRFRDFLRRISDLELKCKLSRMVFFGSGFLGFIQRVLRTIVQSDDADRLTDRWQHVRLCPELVSKILRDAGEDAVRLLSRGFFEVVFGGNLADFALCDFNESPNAARLKVLLTEGAESRLPDLVVALVGLDTEGSSLLEERDARDCPELFQRVLLSRMDDQVLVALQSGAELAWVGAEYHHRLTYRLPLGVDEVRSALLGGTADQAVADGTGGAIHLRHLLQLCDPLPEALPPGPEFGSAMFEVLVNRGPQSTRQRRVCLFKQLGATAEPTAANVGQWARGIQLGRTKQIRAVSTFDRIDKRSLEMARETFEARSNLERAFLASQIRAVYPQLEKPVGFLNRLTGKQKPAAYFKAPERVREALEYGASQLSSVLPRSAGMDACLVGRVLFGFIAREFRFSEYVECRGDLRRSEEELQAAMARLSPAGWADALFPVTQSSSKKEAFLHDQLLAVARDRATLERLEKALGQEVLSRKVARVSCVLADVHARLANASNHVEDVGRDETQQADMALVIFARPASLLYNYAFISDLYRTQPARYSNFFQTESVTYSAALQAAITRLVGKEADDLLPAAETQLWLRRDACG